MCTLELTAQYVSRSFLAMHFHFDIHPGRREKVSKFVTFKSESSSNKKKKTLQKTVKSKRSLW